jgi:hydrogenase nickel incorporation protein HypA/HybF
VHELSIAQNLMDIIQQEAARHGVERVWRVGVSVGAFSAVVPQALRFSFDMVKENTVAHQAELVVREVPLTGRCTECGSEAELDAPGQDCPDCGAAGVELTGGRDLTIDYIETEQ